VQFKTNARNIFNGKKVWTIAIAEEKLDNVIVNANIKRSQLTKVTDRFKTKMHLESAGTVAPPEHVHM
jgi:translation elongation factor P/translation initiation factor 5A